MFGLHGVEVVIFPDVKEGEETAVDPSSALFHQVLVVFHGVCLCNGIGHVSKVVFLFGLAIYA